MTIASLVDVKGSVSHMFKKTDALQTASGIPSLQLDTQSASGGEREWLGSLDGGGEG